MQIAKIQIANQSITDIEDIREILQNEGDYILRALIIQIKETSKNTLSKLEKIFSGEIGTIQVFVKDPQTQAESLDKEYKEYTGMKNLSYQVTSKSFTVNLSMSAARIADAKYKELLAERDKLSKDIDDLNVTIAELIGTKEGA